MITSLRRTLCVRRYAHMDVYRGSRVQFIAAALLKDGEFPGDYGRNLTQQTYKRPLKRVVTRRGRDWYELAFYLAPEEKAKRQAALAGQLAAARARVEIDARLTALPASADAFRDEICDLFDVLLVGARNALDREGGGYRFDDETRERIEDALSVVTDAVRDGPIEFDRAERERRLREIRIEVARGDSDFQAMLARIGAIA
jgi:hypothetical protein